MGGNHAAPPSKFKLQKLLFFLRKFWWIPVITLTLSLGAGVTIFYFTPPTFVAEGSLWETEKMQLPGGAAYTEDRDNYLGTQEQLIKSHMLHELTLTRMRSTQTNNIINGEDGQPLPVDIQVFDSPKSSVYTIEARSRNPVFTTDYLNALMNQYLEYRKNSRKEVSGDTLSSIAEQVGKVERDLKADQAVLADYERTNNFAVLQQESTVAGAYLSKLKTELSDYQLQMKLLDAAALTQDQTAPRPEATNTTDALYDSLRDSVSTDSGRLEAVRQIELLKQQRARLSKYLRPQHPKIVKLDEDIARSQKLINVYQQQSHDQIATARQALQIKINSVQSFVKQWETKVEDVSTRLASADSLRQNIARNQSMYDRLTALLQNVDISRNIDQDTLALLESAGPAKRSYKEGRSTITHAGFIGLAIGLGIIFLLALRDDRFASVVDVTERFGDSVVGQVPDMTERSGGPPLPLLSHNDDRHMFAESYRNLRSALLYVAVDGHRPKTILITSAVPNEGKSTVATNLARTMALGGSKVLLVDADLRKGHIHERLKLPGKPGLTELLQLSQDAAPFIQSTDIESLMFLPRGSISRNPGDLFLNSAFDELLGKLREQYDYVIVDSSPVFAADDSSTLAPKMDGCLFIVRSRFSNARMVREALEVLFQRQARVLGLVLNRSDAKARSYYAYKYAEYYTTAEVVEADEKT
ncbi:MAG TPA: polysaccharide biosynthesis tyrosine autokinase [Verrucomicrobiae bacterium]